MKIYYFLNDINDENYNFLLKKLELLKNGKNGYDLIDSFFYKLGEDNKGRINFSFFMDVICFIETIKEKTGYSYEDILKKIFWVHKNKNFYIYNDDIFETNSKGKYTKINLNKKTYFVTSRDLWLSPFFLILEKLKDIHTNLFVIRPNKREGWIYNDDKIFNFSKLYNFRKEIVGDIVIPLLVMNDKKSISLLLEEVKNKLGNKVVLKENSSEFGKGVKMLKLSDYKTDEKIDYIKMKFINKHYNSIYSIFFVPYFNIKNEFRIYYLYDKEKKEVNIYSIKNRKNKVKGDIFTNTDFEIDKNVNVIWSYTLPSDLDKKYKIFLDNIAINLGFDRGVIEFIETKDNKLIYSEINTLGANILFPEEQNNVFNYWKDVWKLQLNNIL